MSMIFCRGCGKAIHESAPICPHCGAPQHVQAAVTIKPVVAKIAVPAKVEKPMPDGIKGWSWGGFLLNWIWAIGNNTWIGLLALIPVVGIVMSIILGIKGREWAWQNKQWDSLEHFNHVQRKWSMWSAIVVGGLVLIGVLAAIAVPAYQSYQERAAHAAYEQQLALEQQAKAAQLEIEHQARLASFNAQPFGLKEWMSGWGQGVSEFMAHDTKGNGLYIGCTEGFDQYDDVMAIFTIEGEETSTHDSYDSRPKIVIDGKAFDDAFDGCNACSRFEPFWSALRNAKTIQLEKNGKSVEIPTAKIADVLPAYTPDSPCVPSWY